MVTVNNTLKNVKAHRQSILKNLCANLIRNEYIVTTSAKARKAQPLIEKFLSRSIHANKQYPENDKRPVTKRISEIAIFGYLQNADRTEVGTKVIKELTSRYKNRTQGFTRVIKLEPRLGEDKASMSVLELVDSKYEIKFWFTAKAVAKLELQQIPLDDVTELNVRKLTERRIDGEQKFRDAVETCKREFFKMGVDAEGNQVMDDGVDEKLKLSLESLPNMNRHVGNLKGKLLVSKKFKTKSRPQRAEVQIPQSPFLKQTQM
ncbi:mitochondrial 54S ribosomal protein bL17m [Lodderomyces beijingensis]|uniref:50S ribosomal protein L17 n=1 Tax=Lodderomyces beijingensis TaxID=1775926 RepID=A0ABP0ZJN2_9ASCO